MNSRIVLGPNQYGKAEVRLVKITRDTATHTIEDLSITSQLRGDFEAAHLDGDNAHVVATDTQKNTIYSYARDGVGSPEAFLTRLADHFTGDFDWITGGRWSAESYAWDRIDAHGAPHDHSFVRNGRCVRTATLTRAGGRDWLIGGVKDLTVLKSTESGFAGYPKDKYTTLAETDDRILATDVAAKWRYNTTDVDFNKTFDSVTALLLEGFSEGYSSALQNTLFQMGSKVLEAHESIDEIKFSMPNKHHFLVNLDPFGQDNPNEVFYAADRPYGLIEGTVQRDGMTPEPEAWEGIAGFC